MTLTYEDALTAVFLRTLAWELFVAKGKPKVRDVAEKYVQSARIELGLKKTVKGAPYAFIQALRKQGLMDKIFPKEAGWADEWRLLYLPSHQSVRTLSQTPVYQVTQSDFPTKRKPEGAVQYSISLRSPALPKLLVSIGNGRPTQNDKKGLYFLREPSGLYIGQTLEFQTRWDGHTNASGREITWWIFVAPEEKNEDFSLEALNASESLLISFWSEICETSNKIRGRDPKPSVFHMQNAILLVEAASAAILWLLRDQKEELKFENWSLPFKACSANHWPTCYLENPLNPVQSTDDVAEEAEPHRPLTCEDVSPSVGGYLVRVIGAIDGFRARHGAWPSKLRLSNIALEALRENHLTPLGLAMLRKRLTFVVSKDGPLVTEDENGHTLNYTEEGWPRTKPTESATEWVWGLSAEAMSTAN